MVKLSGNLFSSPIACVCHPETRSTKEIQHSLLARIIGSSKEMDCQAFCLRPLVHCLFAPVSHPTTDCASTGAMCSARASASEASFATLSAEHLRPTSVRAPLIGASVMNSVGNLLSHHIHECRDASPSKVVRSCSPKERCAWVHSQNSPFHPRIPIARDHRQIAPAQSQLHSHRQDPSIWPRRMPWLSFFRSKPPAVRHQKNLRSFHWLVEKIHQKMAQYLHHLVSSSDAPGFARLRLARSTLIKLGHAFRTWTRVDIREADCTLQLHLLNKATSNWSFQSSGPPVSSAACFLRT